MIPWIQTVLTSTFIAAVIAVFVKYIIDLRIVRRNDRLARLNEQLKNLYGPLLACVSASETTWLKFGSTWNPPRQHFWRDDIPLTPQEIERWRLYIGEVFMPINIRAENAILQNMHLLEEKSL